MQLRCATPRSSTVAALDYHPNHPIPAALCLSAASVLACDSPSTTTSAVHFAILPFCHSAILARRATRSRHIRSVEKDWHAFLPQACPSPSFTSHSPPLRPFVNTHARTHAHFNALSGSSPQRYGLARRRTGSLATAQTGVAGANMTTDSPWQSRWRSESHYQGHYYDQMRAPQPPASAIGNQISPKLPSSVDSYSTSTSWDGKSRGEFDPYSPRVPSMIDPYADASTYHSRLHQRHTSPGRNSRLTNSPPRQNLKHPWQSLPVDHHPQSRHITEAPLTLHIPQTQGMYNTSLSNLIRSHGTDAFHTLCSC